MRKQEKVNWYQRTQTRLTAAITLAIVLPILAFYLASVKIAADAQFKATQESLRLIAESGSVRLHKY